LVERIGGEAWELPLASETSADVIVKQ
jgi:hypothetical protein